MQTLQVELSHYSVFPKQFLDPKSKYFEMTDKSKMIWMRLFDLFKQARAQGKRVITFRDKKGFATKVLGLSRQGLYKIFKALSDMELIKVVEHELGYYEIHMFELTDEKLYAEPKKSVKKSTGKSIRKSPLNPFAKRAKNTIRQEPVPAGFENWQMADGSTVGTYDFDTPPNMFSPEMGEFIQEAQVIVREKTKDMPSKPYQPTSQHTTEKKTKEAIAFAKSLGFYKED